MSERQPGRGEGRHSRPRHRLLNFRRRGAGQGERGQASGPDASARAGGLTE